MTAYEGEELLHEVRFPGETDEYRRARNELLAAEIAARRQLEAVAAQRRTLPLGGEPPTDYVFDEWDEAAGAARPVRLSELFADGKDTLFLYSFMFIPGEKGLPLEQGCPSCTSILDAIDGESRHVVQRINFAVVAKAPIAQFRAHAESRGWRHARLLSSAGTTYNADYHAERPDGAQLPIATVFARRDGRIRHVWSSELLFAPVDPGQHPRHVDFMWPLWAIFDRVPDGRGTDWDPSARLQLKRVRDRADGALRDRVDDEDRLVRARVGELAEMGREARQLDRRRVRLVRPLAGAAVHRHEHAGAPLDARTPAPGEPREALRRRCRTRRTRRSTTPRAAARSRAAAAPRRRRAAARAAPAAGGARRPRRDGSARRR